MRMTVPACLARSTVYFSQQAERGRLGGGAVLPGAQVLCSLV